MKYFKNWDVFKNINEAVNILDTIKNNPTVPLLSIKTGKNEKTVPYVKLLQNTLSTQGYSVDVSGYFDEKTRQAVLDYQSSQGLSKDGVVGKNTWKSILSLNNIDIEPKIINLSSAQPTNVAPKVDAKHDNTVIKPTKTNEPMTEQDFQFIDSHGSKRNFSELKKAPNSKGAWFNTKDTIHDLIIKNNNRHFILELNKLYEEKKGKSLISYMTNEYSKSLLGGRASQIGIDVFNILLNYIITPTTDAQVLNFAIDGIGTEDELLNLIINKRSNESDDYKLKIASEYKKNYQEELVDDLEDDLDVDDEDDRKLISKIIPNYYV